MDYNNDRRIRIMDGEIGIHPNSVGIPQRTMDHIAPKWSTYTFVYISGAHLFYETKLKVENIYEKWTLICTLTQNPLKLCQLAWFFFH